MKNKKHLSFLILILICFHSIGQNKLEREHRIKKSQFPEAALAYVNEELVNVRRMRFYKEIDTSKIRYDAKFKKDRLKYILRFGENGTLERVAFLIEPIDIPNDAFAKINGYLKKEFSKFRIKKIKQQYPLSPITIETAVKDAFQNLMIPSLKYELIVSGRKNKGLKKFNILFDAEGNFEHIKSLLPANYDHILY